MSEGDDYLGVSEMNTLDLHGKGLYSAERARCGLAEKLLLLWLCNALLRPHSYAGVCDTRTMSNFFDHFFVNKSDVNSVRFTCIRLNSWSLFHLFRLCTILLNQNVTNPAHGSEPVIEATMPQAIKVALMAEGRGQFRHAGCRLVQHYLIVTRS